VTHPLTGFAAVEESARLIRNYRYATERMMRILGGWIALTPELSAKLLMGRHVWDNAQHADALGRRLPELRAAAHVSEPANAAFVAFLDALEQAERPHQTVERLTGVYRVLKPHLLDAYEWHLAQANEVYEPPTRRILERCAADERRHVASGRVILQHVTATPADEERIGVWQARLETLLRTAGGVTGRGLPPRSRTPDLDGTAASLSDAADELIRLEQSGTGWIVPEDLESAIRAFGDAVVGGDPKTVRRLLLPEAAGDDVEMTLVSTRWTGHRTVAFTKVGRQRLIKLRLDGSDASITLAMRWVPVEHGWRVASLELIARDAPRPA
jgi:hypothetical protein